MIASHCLTMSDFVWRIRNVPSEKFAISVEDGKVLHRWEETSFEGRPLSDIFH